MRALVVTNMWPTAERPAFGSFVRDQVTALQARGDVEVEVFAFGGGARGYPRAVRELRRRFRGQRFDVIHAHFGLTAWVALAGRLGPVVVTLHGNDLLHPRTRRLTLPALGRVALVSAVSRAFSEQLEGAGRTRRVAILPVGVDTARFRPIPRAVARQRLGLPADQPVLLFPHDPGRTLKGVERAREAAGDVRLLTLGAVAPDEVPYWINAANAVLVPSHDEGFGLAVIEASACDVPVLATPVGIHPTALDGIDGSHCLPWDAAAWRARLAPILAADDPRVAGRGRAELFSADRLADRVVAAWREVAA